MKILIVEDDVNSRVFLERALLSQGYAVESAANGVQALEKVAISLPDLIVSDIMMPEMDGFELCRRLKADERFRAVPFVFYTATYIDQKDEKLGMALGAARFLIKPMEPKEFFRTINKVIEEHLAGNIPVRDRLPAEMSERDRMQSETYARKLDKKVKELEKDREALRRSDEELKFQNIILSTQQEASIDGILVVDEHNSIISYNKRFIEMWKIPLPAVESRDDEQVLQYVATKPVDPEGFLSRIKHLYEHRDEKSREEIVLKDGRIFDRYSAPMIGDDGKYYGRVWYFRDITERKKLETQLFQAQKMEAVGQLAGGIAHDFNNILTAVIGYAHMLKMKLKDDNSLGVYADHILSLSDKAANLTQSLLAFSRKQVMNPRPINLNEVIRTVEKLLLRIIGEDIQLTTDLSAQDLIVMADHIQMEQILMNLATNARDAMPAGGRLIIGTETVDIDHEFIGKHGYGQEGTYAVISVTDSGEGMDSETREKIFEPFFTTKEVGKGTGLGLSMVYGIIKQHGGYINVYSEPGKGTTFRIYLPLIQAAADGVKSEVIPSVETGTESILLAEDEPDVRRFIRELLQEYGYEVIDAADGDDAIDKFKLHKDRIQLVLLDVIMPKRNGREVYEAIRHIAPDIKVLFTSGYPAEHITGMIAEGSEYILKPVSPTKLLQKIREVLDK